MSRTYEVGDTVEHAQVGDRGTIVEVKSNWKRQPSGTATRVHKYVVDWDNGPQGHPCGPRTFSK